MTPPSLQFSESTRERLNMSTGKSWKVPGESPTRTPVCGSYVLPGMSDSRISADHLADLLKRTGDAHHADCQRNNVLTPR
jgi:hypothetical protein